MQITFFGAAGGVTGSKHLVETEHDRVLLDCGTFQGLPDVRERNRSLPFPPESINHVVLSHAHIDHCGMLPLLVKRGFTGSIVSTPATRDVTERMLLDSAGIEEQDATYRQKYHIGSPDDREPLYTTDDIPATMEQFVPVPYAREKNEWHEISSTARCKFYDAGHILGSAVTVLEFDEGGATKRLAYTGDLGAPDTPLLPDPEVPAEDVGTILVESTYGSRIHQPLENAIGRLADFINRVVDRKGKIIIPAFSLGRTQVVVYLLHRLTDQGKIPRLPIIVDSPLATDITEVFRKHNDLYDPETEMDFGEDDAPLAFRNLTYTQSKEESQELNRQRGPFIVVSASGMMTAGRVVHHLRHSISDPKNAVIITGYQAEGTLGRRLLEGARRVELYGDWFTVKAEIEVINEFSAHADQAQLREYLGKWQGLQNVYLVHGEPSQADELRDVLSQDHGDWRVVRPNEGDTVEI